MKTKQFNRVLSVILAIVCVLQTFCMPVYASDESSVPSVQLMADCSADLVNETLTQVLLGTDEAGRAWEYYCEGRSIVNTTNKAWGSIEGFESTTGKVVKTKYNHPALSSNVSGRYQVRVAGQSKTYEINFKKIEKTEAPYTEAGANQVNLVYTEEGTLDYAELEEKVFGAIIEESEIISLDNVHVEYYATAKTGSLGAMGKEWMPLEGGKKNGLQYDGITAGEQEIRIVWAGNDLYLPTTIRKTINFVERPEAPYVLNDNTDAVKMHYTDGDNGEYVLDIDGLYRDIFDAVIAESEVLSLDNVNIEYYATAKTGSLGAMGKEWMPLEGGKKNALVYEAISGGEQKIRISWPGNRQYAPTSVEANVVLKDREPIDFNLKEGPFEVGFTFADVANYDYDATAAAIVDAVIDTTSPIQIKPEEIKVTYNASAIGTDLSSDYKPLDNSDFGTKKFGEGTWTIKLSWAGNREYAASSVKASVTMIDNRLASEVVLKEGTSFVYNKDVTVMKQNILDYVIDWNNSTLPTDRELTVDDFEFAYLAQLSVLDGASGDIADGIIDEVIGNDKVQKAYVPFEGKTYEVLGQTLGKYPQIGAGEQSIRVTYKGDANFKPSIEAEQTVSIAKAKVKVSVKSSSVYVSESAKGLSLVSTNPEDDFDTYVIYSGVTRDLNAGIYMELPDRYVANSNTIKLLDKLLASLGQPTFTEMLQNGVTIGELRNLLNMTEVIELLEKLGIDTGAFGQIITVINKLPSITDNVRIGFGTPNKVGTYTVTAICANKNYKTGVGVGALLVKADKAKLVWNQTINKTISVKDVAGIDFGATLTVNGEAVKDQTSVRVLYSGVKNNFRLYSSTTTAPTEPGRYTMTVVAVGGNYLATPITRSFQIKQNIAR